MHLEDYETLQILKAPEWVVRLEVEMSASHGRIPAFGSQLWLQTPAPMLASGIRFLPSVLGDLD